MTPDKATLMAALPHVQAAPKSEGPVTLLCTRPQRNLRAFPARITVSRAQGIPNERWLTEPWLRLPDGSPDPDIQVSILNSRVLDLVWRTGDTVPHPGDPVVADLDLSEANLPAGSLLQAGTSVLQVSGLFNDGCVKWNARYGLDARAWITAPAHVPLRLRGILCAVHTDGIIAVGDRLRVLSRPPGTQGR